MTYVTLRTNPQALNIFRKILFRSSAYALAAWFYSLILEKALTVAGAVISGYSTSIDYQGVEILIDPRSWNQDSVLLIYMAPYLVQAILVLLIYINLKKLQATPGYMMIFLHWLILFITFRITAMLPIHILCHTGIYHALSWLYLGTALEVIISVIGITIFMITAKWMIRGVLFFSATLNDTYRVIGLSNLIRSSLLGPVSLIFVVSGLFYLPGLPREEILGLLAITAISIFTILRLMYTRPEQLPKGAIIPEKFSPVLLVPIILLFIIILRLLLGIGITI